MSIKTKLNGDIKTANSIVVGGSSGTKVNIGKVVTKINGQRYVIYGHEEPPVLENYYYYIGSQGFTKTKDFFACEPIISNAQYNLSYNATDGQNVFVWDMQLSGSTYTLKNCYIVDKRDNVTTHACQYTGLPSGTMEITGGEHKIYYKGLFYDTIIIRNSNTRDFYLVSSSNGYSWQVDTLLFTVSGSYFGATLLDGISDGTNDYLTFAERYSSGSGNRLKAINLETKSIITLADSIYGDYAPKISVRITDSEVIVHGFKPYTSSGSYHPNHTYSVKVVGGQVTATTITSSYIWRTPTLFYDGNHYYGGGQSEAKVYYDTTSIATSSNFINMTVAEDGVLAFDNSGKMYSLDSTGTLELITVTPNIPANLYNNYAYPNILTLKK